MSESEAVSGHIRVQQGAVLARAINTLEHSSRDELPEELHRLRGTLGTYLLDDAVAVLVPLEIAVHGQADELELSMITQQAITRLRALADTKAGGA